ncbi:sporulation protein SsgA, partial [Streptomyces sp. A73]|nr:sporulation protein SsgA [Streptomyces sp. A73]
LEGRLRNIPDTSGSMGGARARARRVTRHLRRVAQAEKLIAKSSSALYSAFEREYESELMKIGTGRSQQKPTPRFNWR